MMSFPKCVCIWEYEIRTVPHGSFSVLRELDCTPNAQRWKTWSLQEDFLQCRIYECCAMVRQRMSIFGDRNVLTEDHEWYIVAWKNCRPGMCANGKEHDQGNFEHENSGNFVRQYLRAPSSENSEQWWIRPTMPCNTAQVSGPEDYCTLRRWGGRRRRRRRCSLAKKDKKGRKEIS